MLSPKHRLAKTADIQQVIRLGKRAQTPFATLYILIPALTTHTRISCVVGKKADKSAVGRHRIQRRLRAAASALPLMQGNPYDMVIVASNTQARSISIEEITTHIAHAITTAHST